MRANEVRTLLIYYHYTPLTIRHVRAKLAQMAHRNEIRWVGQGWYAHRDWRPEAIEPPEDMAQSAADASQVPVQDDDDIFS